MPDRGDLQVPAGGGELRERRIPWVWVASGLAALLVVGLIVVILTRGDGEVSVTGSTTSSSTASSTTASTTGSTTEVQSPSSLATTGALPGTTVSTLPPWEGHQLEEMPGGEVTIDGQGTGLVSWGGFCLAEGGESCAHSITAAAETGPGPGTPDAFVVFLSSLVERLPGGEPVWRVTDVVSVTPPPGSTPVGECRNEGRSVWALVPLEQPPGDTFAPSAAWGADADFTAIVELPATEVTCVAIVP